MYGLFHFPTLASWFFLLKLVSTKELETRLQIKTTAKSSSALFLVDLDFIYQKGGFSSRNKIMDEPHSLVLVMISGGSTWFSWLN